MSHALLLKPKANARITFILALALGLMGLKTGKLLAQNTILWKMHVIDNSLLGADGVRFDDANNDKLQDVVTRLGTKWVGSDLLASG